ncbi:MULTISPECIES: DUF4234 domain-containing protein [unclassified Butyrivibrio]|uniref:DUF4234 domain-containing protein n=1 Tax=unclassified Butyrivibrio TaxID=2639466 RepID=UPI000413D670|nr:MULTISPECIES: DUF4234 domain-containing protein [unclassified Butyrivibrio]
MFCPNCGTENPDSTNFCTNCGAKLVPDNDAQNQAPQNGPFGFDPNNTYNGNQGNPQGFNYQNDSQNGGFNYQNGNPTGFNYQNGDPNGFQQYPYYNPNPGITGRSIALAIIFSLITCGIYNIYWFIVLTDETNVLCNRQHETSGVVAFLLSIVTCGIYSWYWAFKLGEKVDQIKGEQSSSNSILFIILQLIGLGLVVEAIAQDAINKAVNYQ